MLKRLLGAAIVVAGVGAAVAAKLLNDQKKNTVEPEEDNDVHFITLADGDGINEPSFDASDKSEEVQEICGVYPYLNPDFVENLLDNSEEFNQMFEKDTLITIHHHVLFDNQHKLTAFGDIMSAAGYEVSEEGVSKRIFTEDGAIISDILNVANQAAVLDGVYDTFSIDAEK